MIIQWYWSLNTFITTAASVMRVLQTGRVFLIENYRGGGTILDSATGIATGEGGDNDLQMCQMEVGEGGGHLFPLQHGKILTILNKFEVIS